MRVRILNYGAHPTQTGVVSTVQERRDQTSQRRSYNVKSEDGEMTTLDKRQCAGVAFWCDGKLVKTLDHYCGPIPRRGEELVMLSPLKAYRVVAVGWHTSDDEWMGLYCNVVLEDAPEKESG
jgi:hypothetical protein